MAVSLVLGLAIAAEAANIVVSLAMESSLASGRQATALLTQRGRGRLDSPLRAIAAAHLFGVAPREMSAGSARDASRAPLILTGTIATADPRNGFAIVGSSPTTTHAVYTGSEAEPGTILAEVYPQAVILQRGHERLTLRLPRGPLGGASGAPGFLPRERPIPVARDDGDGSEEGMDSPSQPPPRPRLTDGMELWHAFALRPASVAGERGARIGGTEINSQALAALGLAPGDVIVQVNGVKVGAPNAPALMNALQQGGATLVIDRGGEDTSVTIDRSAMAGAAALYRQASPDL